MQAIFGYELRIGRQGNTPFSPHREHVSKLGETLDAIWHKRLPGPAMRSLAERLVRRTSSGVTLRVSTPDRNGGVEVWIPIKS
ncbi:MAG TPA: hypothetical protein VOA41_15470 [Candidatus Dormibacteraeota bacterium]|nr:hypothetical protein [Candidatus Dormibacteraeota bacterium]